MWRFFGSPFLADFWTSDDPYTPWTPNIILSEALNVILDHLGGFGMVFRFLKSESFWKRSYTPKSVAFGRIRGFSKRLIFLNSVLDTQNDLKPTIIQYNICCTYKKRLDYVVRSKKKWKGGSGGSGEGKNRPKKGHFYPKTAKKCAGSKMIYHKQFYEKLQIIQKCNLQETAQ